MVHVVDVFFLMIRRPPRSTLFPHDALPISWYFLGGFSAYLSVPSGRRWNQSGCSVSHGWSAEHCTARSSAISTSCSRSEEHTSELQSRQYLVCRLLLEKTKILSRPLEHPSL